ncbi:MAG: DUF4412 domain-containing protein [candidate division Zixibacteria bacterium]|nr:DUF4412 domain-containing protein [candidate division Zixibacteria bacterium]
MNKIVSSGRLTVAVILIIMIAFCNQGISAEFSADLQETIGKKTSVGKIFVKGLKYRMEKMEGDLPLIILVDQETNVTQVINVSEKAYIEMPSTDMQSLTNDPFQSLKYIADIPDASIKQIGKETVSGIECNKSTVLYGETDYFTQWVSGKYDFPLKIIAHAADDMVVELINIKEGAVDDALFAVPEGYTLIAEEQPPPPAEPVKEKPLFPDWMKDAASAELVELPLEKVMVAGDMIRIKVMAGMNIAVFGTNNHGGNSTFYAIPCLNGEPIDEPSAVFAEYGSTRAFSMMMQGQLWPTTLTETPDQADIVLVRVEEGQVMMKIEYNKKP